MEGVHHGGSAIGGANLETYESVVKLKLKNFLLDFSAMRRVQRSSRDHHGDRFDVS
jgi:hypothetical protein